jgi:hypothetical protein
VSRAAVVALLVAALGCDDRAKIATDIFTCNPSSPTADHDCGDGFVCYSAAQSIGAAICVPRCDPTTPSSCDGACSTGGACLRRCTVESGGGCAPGLTCVRTTISTLESGTNDGVCLPINAGCTVSSDCQSSIFNVCLPDIDLIVKSDQLAASGSICFQGACAANGSACEPGSSCVRDVVPQNITQAPDVCSPNCTTVGDGGVNQCLVGFTCLSDAFPQSRARVCAPGAPGWLCVDDLGCLAGKCADWANVSPSMAAFRTCSPKCATDDDCAPYDHDNPNYISKMTCHAGVCRSWGSLFFGDTCFKLGETCRFDDKALCLLPGLPDGGAPDDGGAPPPPVDTCTPPDFDTPLGALGGVASICTRSCSSHDDCAALESATHVPHVCTKTGVCQPSIPFVTGCALNNNGKQTICLGDLECLSTMTKNGMRSTCTKHCTVDDDCANDAALGSTYFCSGTAPLAVCAPRVRSGCPPLLGKCLSGMTRGAVCASPSGWTCQSDDQCVSGSCNANTRCD